MNTNKTEQNGNANRAHSNPQVGIVLGDIGFYFGCDLAYKRAEARHNRDTNYFEGRVRRLRAILRRYVPMLCQADRHYVGVCIRDGLTF